MKKQVAVTTDAVAVETPVVVEKPKYAKTMDNTIGAREADSEAVLKDVPVAAPRPGTARFAAYAALVANIGEKRPAVLAAVAEAERQWHRDAGRAPKAVSPIGWLRTFNAKF